ncbi:MAG: SUF system NifU family Fe-S cluster assembly protein [Erysipelotrichaceae bacterium]|nr:SUF system NifU family Fe-S cluster assembly protein [Erysipelotrichaceae bacterium]
MHIFDDPMMIRQVILDHYQYPRNKGLTNDFRYGRVRMNSESCVDDINVEMLVEDGVIKDIRFDGIACTISTASTSIMSELLKNKTVSEAKNIIDNYMNMIDEKEYDEDLLEEAGAFKNTYKQANRIKCATIGWRGVSELLEKEGKHE